MKTAAAKQISAADRQAMLDGIYRVHANWVSRLVLACHKGCCACCTRSVTMTDLEGEAILCFAEKNHRTAWLREKLADVPAARGPGITMNRFADACLSRREVDDEVMDWNFAPCVFLDDSVCTIYEVRPFGCRSFGSLVKCGPDQPAEITPLHLAVNTVFTQVIEHLSSDGGSWSSLTNILHSLVSGAGRDDPSHLLPAQPVPGFLLDPNEARVIRKIVEPLYEFSSLRSLFTYHLDTRQKKAE